MREDGRERRDEGDARRGIRVGSVMRDEGDERGWKGREKGGRCEKRDKSGRMEERGDREWKRGIEEGGEIGGRGDDGE